MARPSKQGLSYYNIEPNFQNDIKIQMAEDYLDTSGSNGFLSGDNNHLKLIMHVFLVRSWNLIYGDHGYYMEWRPETSLALARQCFTRQEIINLIVDALLHVGWFDKDKYDKYSILTSNGIQKRFFKVSNAAKRTEVKMVEEYLILPEENPIIQKYLKIRKSKSSGIKTVSSGRNHNKKGKNTEDIKPDDNEIPTSLEYIECEGEFLPEETELLQEIFRKKLPLNKYFIINIIYKGRIGKGRLSNIPAHIVKSPLFYDCLMDSSFFRKKQEYIQEETELVQEEIIKVPVINEFLPEETIISSGSNASNSVENAVKRYKEKADAIFLPEESILIYFNSQSLAGTRETLCQVLGVTDITMLHRWAKAYNQWLYLSPNFEKTMKDWADHFFKWMKKKYKSGLVPEEIHGQETHNGQQYGGTKQTSGKNTPGKFAGIDTNKVEDFINGPGE